MSNGSVADERQPLLPPAALLDEPVLAIHDEENPLVEQDAEIPPEKGQRSWWTIAWYTLFTVVGILLLALFIKGFIDADDVEVCI